MKKKNVTRKELAVSVNDKLGVTQRAGYSQGLAHLTEFRSRLLE
jgi:hypothetical protein